MQNDVGDFGKPSRFSHANTTYEDTIIDKKRLTPGRRKKEFLGQAFHHNSQKNRRESFARQGPFQIKRWPGFHSEAVGPNQPLRQDDHRP